MITIHKRGKVWWAQSTFNGVQRRWSLRTRDRNVAEALRRQAELDKLGGLSPKPWAEFQEEALAWIAPRIGSKTLREYRRALDKLGAFLTKHSIVNVNEVGSAEITAFMEAKRKELHPSRKRPMTDGGVKFYLRTLKRFFSYAVDCKYIASNPVLGKNLNATPGLTQPFSQAEIDAVLGSFYLNGKPGLRAIVLTFLHTGLRLGDVRDLRKDDVAQGFSVIRTRKRKKDIVLHVHKDLRAALAGHFAAMNAAEKESPLLFPAANGSPMASMDKHLTRLFTHAGIHGGHAHRFRDTFAVRLLEKGASLYDVAKLLGISHQTAELHYTPYCRELQQRAARLIGMLDFKAKRDVLKLRSAVPKTRPLSITYGDAARGARKRRNANKS